MAEWKTVLFLLFLFVSFIWYFTIFKFILLPFLFLFIYLPSDDLKILSNITYWLPRFTLAAAYIFMWTAFLRWFCCLSFQRTGLVFHLLGILCFFKFTSKLYKFVLFKFWLLCLFLSFFVFLLFQFIYALITVVEIGC